MARPTLHSQLEAMECLETNSVLHQHQHPCAVAGVELLQVQRVTALLSTGMLMVRCHIATREARQAEVQLMDLSHVVARD